ncbi:MAG TPA: hypothetical protein VG838_09220 [Opitutaceae bacterium]|nr:hypothetical protein [Opitutaceae bacterium]
MTLTPEQKQAVAGWIAAGDNLSAVQKKLADQFKLALTYRDVRFLVDDLNLELKDPAPKVDTSDVSKAPAARPTAAPAEKKGFFDKAKEKLGLAKDDADDAGEGNPPEDDALPPAGPGGVTVSVDKVTLIPGVLASGTVTFGDGVTGKWIIDQQGRPGLTEVSKPHYRPTPGDAQAFMQELSRQLQQRGY